MEDSILVQEFTTITFREILTLLRDFGDVLGACLRFNHGMALTNADGYTLLFTNLKAGGDTLCNNVVARTLAICGFGTRLDLQKWLLDNPEFDLERSV